METLAKVRKALIALFIATGGAVITALGEQSPGGESILASEWWTAGGLGLAAAGAVFLVPNALTSAQKAKVVAEYQAARFRGSTGHTRT